MNSLNRENTSSPSGFAEQLRRMRDAQQPDVTRIPDLKQWMQYWNDEESEAHNLRNIQHWLSRVTQ